MKASKQTNEQKKQIVKQTEMHIQERYCLIDVYCPVCAFSLKDDSKVL